MSFLVKLTDLPEGHETTRSDFEKRYLNTYMVEVYQGKPMVVLFLGCDGPQYHFRDIISGNVHIYQREHDVDITPLLPGVGYYNVNGSPIYLYKVPQKQYKRSFCNSIYNVPGIGPQNMRTAGTIWKDIALETINPTYAHLDEITKRVFSYVALNRKFAIQQDSRNNMNLLYRQYVVGKLDFHTKTVVIVQPSLRQEVEDLFKYTGVQKWTLK